jgi:ABC-type uncharacterized transport system ATPase subunit
MRQVMERCEISDVSIIEPDIDSIVRRIYLEGYGVSRAGTPS